MRRFGNSRGAVFISTERAVKKRTGKNKTNVPGMNGTGKGVKTWQQYFSKNRH
jgi:hypothetical protein